MIVDSIIQFFINAINGFIDLIPNDNPLGSNAMDISGLVSVINHVSCIVPIGTFMSALGIMIAFQFTDLIVGIIHWLLKKIPGVN